LLSRMDSWMACAVSIPPPMYPSQGVSLNEEVMLAVRFGDGSAGQ